MNHRPFARLLLGDLDAPAMTPGWRRFRFGLKSLFVLITAAAILSAVPLWWSHWVERPYRSWEYFATQLACGEMANARGMITERWAAQYTGVANVPPLNDKVMQATALQFDAVDRRRYVFYNPRLQPSARTAGQPESTSVCVLELPENVVRVFCPQRRDSRTLKEKWRGELLIVETSRFIPMPEGTDRERELLDFIRADQTTGPAILTLPPAVTKEHSAGVHPLGHGMLVRHSQVILLDPPGNLRDIYVRGSGQWIAR